MSTQNQLRGSEEAMLAVGTIHRKINTIPVAANVAYFQVEYTVELPETVPANFREHYKPTLTSGFAPPADIIAFRDDQATDIKPVAQMRIVPPGFREMAQRSRFMDAFQAHQAAIVAKTDYLEDLRSGTIDLDDIVLLDIGSHMLFDRHGQVLPVGIYFDYNTGGFHSGRYHMDVALEVLSQDSRVLPAPVCGRDPEASLHIMRVADYFSTDYYDQRHICFIFAPTVEDMRAIWDKCKSYGGAYPSTMLREAIFDLDILHLRAEGAAKYDTYYGVDDLNDNK